MDTFEILAVYSLYAPIILLTTSVVVFICIISIAIDSSRTQKNLKKIYTLLEQKNADKKREFEAVVPE